MSKYSSQEFYDSLSTTQQWVFDRGMEVGREEAAQQATAQAQEAVEAARADELEACIETVKTLTPYLAQYFSNISSEPTRKDIIEALERRKYLPK